MPSHKANILREYEDYGYQVSYYLLQNKSLAFKVTRQAFLNICKDQEFFVQSKEKQKDIIKRAIMKQILSDSFYFNHSLLSQGR